jgi:hypothetical protein
MLGVLDHRLSFTLIIGNEKGEEKGVGRLKWKRDLYQ